MEARGIIRPYADPADTYFRFGIALSFVGIALGLSLLSQQIHAGVLPVLLSGAVMLAGWFGRTAAGLFAVMISMITVGITLFLHTAPLQWSSMNFHTSSRFCPAHW